MLETIISKTCSCCKKPKGLDEFRRNKSGKLGRDNQCKTCKAIYAKSEQGKKCLRAANQRYIHTNKGKATRKAYAQSQKAKKSMRRYLDSPHGRLLHNRHTKQWSQTEKGKAYRKKVEKHYREKYPDKTKARVAISHEVESGRLPSAKTCQCEHCSKQATNWHHYLGYLPEHWLDVIPLCHACDTIAHSS